MAHLLSSECHTTDTTLCYKMRPCGTVCITCTTVGVPSLCMELHTCHTPLHTSSPEPCVVTNTTAKHQSHRTIALCGNIPHYINLVGRELQQLLGGGSAVSHVSRAMNLDKHLPHTNYQNEGSSIPCSHNTKYNKRGIWETSVRQPAQ